MPGEPEQQRNNGNSIDNIVVVVLQFAVQIGSQRFDQHDGGLVLVRKTAEADEPHRTSSGK